MLLLQSFVTNIYKFNPHFYLRIIIFLSIWPQIGLRILKHLLHIIYIVFFTRTIVCNVEGNIESNENCKNLIPDSFKSKYHPLLAVFLYSIKVWIHIAPLFVSPLSNQGKQKYHLLSKPDSPISWASSITFIICQLVKSFFLFLSA